MCYYCVYISDTLAPIERLTVLCSAIESEPTMQRAKNDTHEDETIDPAAQARFRLMVSVYIPAFLISEIGNGIVIYSLVYLKRRTRRAIDNFILNLAVGDFILTTFSLLNATEYMKNEWKLGEVMCKVHGQVMETCYIVATLTLLAISYNRRKVANDRFKILNARENIKRNIGSIWLAAFVLTSPLTYAYTVAKRNGRRHCSSTNLNKTYRSVYYLLQGVFAFFIPVVIMIVSQRMITKGLKSHFQTCRMVTKNAHFQRMISHEKKVSKFLTWIWIVFVCCFTPHITLRTIDHFTSIRINEIWNQIWHVSQILALLNSAINPFLYYRSTNRDGAKINFVVNLFCCIRRTRTRDVSNDMQQTHTSLQGNRLVGLRKK